MKRYRLYTLIAVLLLSAALFVACGKKGGGDGGSSTTTPVPEYEISFSVGGSVTKQTLKQGEMPVFAGSTDKAADTENGIYYHFTGWDKEIVPAAADATYTAQYQECELTTVAWQLYDGSVVESIAGVGVIPTPPAAALVEFLTNDQVMTLAAWDRALAPATKNDVPDLYVGVYTSAPRYYKVIFKVDGAEVATGRAQYNTIAHNAYAGDAELPSGYNSILWIDGNRRVTEENIVVNGGYVNAKNGQLLSSAYTTALMGFLATGNDNTGDVYAEATAVLYMLDEIRSTASPDATTDLLIDRCVASLTNLVDGADAAPYFDLEPTWPYVPMTGAILLAKNTPAVWDELSAPVKEQLDFVMEVLAYVLTLGTDDTNNYKTGPGMNGNFDKNWNPNYQLANVLPMLFIGKYFGGAKAVNTMLHAFSYDAVVARFQEYGFVRAYANWTKPNPVHPDTGETLPGTKTFMENGGPAYTKLREDSAGDRLNITEGKAAGSGVGVRTDYTYGGYNVDQLSFIFGKLIDSNYGGGNVTSSKDITGDGVADAYILDGTASPYEGKAGMMKEFNSGTRSSANYCSHDFMMVITALFVFEQLDMYDVEAPENAARLQKIWVGNQDFLYKYEHGYNNTSGYNSTSVSYERTAGAHFFIWKTIWLEGAGRLAYEELPEPVDTFVFDPILKYEDFSETSMDFYEISDKINNFTFGNGKSKTGMKTVTGEDGNTYLLVTQNATGSDTLLNLSLSGGPAKLMADYNTLIISLDLARQAGVATNTTELRLRGKGGSSDVIRVLQTGSGGGVNMLGQPLTTLTEAFQNIKLRIDFEAGTVTGYVDGVEKATVALTVPGASSATTPAEWRTTLTSYIFNWWFQKPGSTDRALLVDNISVTVEVPDEAPAAT